MKNEIKNVSYSNIDLNKTSKKKQKQMEKSMVLCWYSRNNFNCLWN